MSDKSANGLLRRDKVRRRTVVVVEKTTETRPASHPLAARLI